MADSCGVVNHFFVLPVPNSLHSRRGFVAGIFVLLNCSDCLPVKFVRVFQFFLRKRSTAAGKLVVRIFVMMSSFRVFLGISKFFLYFSAIHFIFFMVFLLALHNAIIQHINI